MSPWLDEAANHIWQSTLAVLAIWGITRLLRGNSAAVRHRLWLCASVKFLVPFSVLTMVGGAFASPAATPALDAAVAVASIAAPFSAMTFASSLRPSAETWDVLPALLVGLWGLGSAAFVTHWWYRWKQLRTIVRSSPRIDLQQPIDVHLCEHAIEPGVLGILHPVLLLPARPMPYLTGDELDAIVAHELCHVRRRDNFAMALHMTVEALFWFHPLVWVIERRLTEEQERACDEYVLGRGTPPDVYARGILQVCELATAPAPGWMPRMTGRDLTRRIEVIMANQPTPTLPRSKKLMLGIAALVLIGGPVVLGAAFQGPSAAASAWVGTWKMNIDATRFPDPTGRRVGANPYSNGFYIIRVERAADGLRITRESQPYLSAPIDREEITVPFDGTEVPAPDPDAPGRTVAFASGSNAFFDVIRRTPRPTGGVDIVRQRYTFAADGRTLTWTWHGENPAPAWQLGVLVFDREG